MTEDVVPAVPPVEPAPPADSAPPSPTTGFLEEAPGERSAMRLISVICVGAAVILAGVITWASLKGNQNTGVGVQMVTTLLSAGVIGKVAQKFTEN